MSGLPGGIPRGLSSNRRRPRPEYAEVLAIAAVFAVTTRWLGWEEAIDLLGAGDAYSYQVMSAAAPGLPDTRIGSAYTDRYLPHWLIGAVAKGMALPLTSVYRLGWAAGFVGVLGVIHAILRTLDLPRWPRRLCLALVALNPYALRFYALAPGLPCRSGLPNRSRDRPARPGVA